MEANFFLAIDWTGSICVCRPCGPTDDIEQGSLNCKRQRQQQQQLPSVAASLERADDRHRVRITPLTWHHAIGAD